MAGPFVARFRSVLESLFGRSFTDTDGLSDAELDRIGHDLPEALRDFYTVAGRFEPVLEAHNRFYSPGRFSRIDGKLVFCEENQAVVYWGYDEDQGWRTDPPVHQGINNDTIEWYLEAERCSEFLTGMIYWQALNGGLPHVRFANASKTTHEAVSAWPRVFQQEDNEVFSRGALVFALIQRGQDIEIQAASRSEAELDELWKSLGL